jgi:uncharacterized protein (TIGR00251 family)
LPRTSSNEGPLRPAVHGVRIAIRLTPRARANRIDGIVQDAAGAPVLKIAVAAPPAEGRANEALLQLLAREWRLPRRDLSLASGAANRNKVVHVAGDPAALLDRLGAELGIVLRP